MNRSTLSLALVGLALSTQACAKEESTPKENVVAEEKAVVEEKAVAEEQKANTFKSSICNAEVAFKDEPVLKNQEIKLPNAKMLNMTQAISKFTLKGKGIASNVLCQSIEGQKYAGTDQEWAAYIKRNLEGIVKSGAKEVRLSLAAGEDKIYLGNSNHKEYMISFDLDGNKQEIYTLALLDKDLSTVYSLSVSGNRLVSERIKMEFEALVSTLKFKY